MTDTNHRHLSTSDEKTEQQVPDIVERLLEVVPDSENGMDLAARDEATLREAAAEIGRLRFDLASWKHSYKLLDELRERMRAERDAAVADAERYRKGRAFYRRVGVTDTEYDRVFDAELDAAIDAARGEK